jgi:hypothetical protein
MSITGALDRWSTPTEPPLDIDDEAAVSQQITRPNFAKGDR